jgi:hypothetical protein
MVHKENYKRLIEVVKPLDTLGILISADPDAMLGFEASFLAESKKDNYLSYQHH